MSGLLTAVALSRSEASALYRRRFRSIVVPMLLWSVTTVALYALLSFARPTFLTEWHGGSAETLLFYVNAVLFLTDQPMGPTLHLGFLRDLFVCMLLSPLLLGALRRFGAAVPVALGALYLFDVESVVMLRPLVLFAFSIGLWLATRGARLDALDASWRLWVGASVIATLAVMVSGTDAALGSAPARWFAERGLDLREAVLYPASRLCGALAIWTLAAKLVGTAWNRRLARLSSYVFVAFCSHFLVLAFLWEGVVRPLVGASDTLGYALWFAVAPFVAMAVAAGIVESAARLAPSLASLLTGGRAPVRSAAFGARANGPLASPPLAFRPRPGSRGAEAAPGGSWPTPGRRASGRPRRRPEAPEAPEVVLEGVCRRRSVTGPPATRSARRVPPPRRRRVRSGARARYRPKRRQAPSEACVTGFGTGLFPVRRLPAPTGTW